MKNLIDLVIGAKEDRRAWRSLQKRAGALPEDYRFVYKKMQAYMLNFAGGDGMDIVRLCDGLVELFEGAIAEGKPAAAVIGSDPAAFCDDLVRNADTWTDKWRTRLNESIREKLEEKR
jgi:DNA-binding ferritin-like protein (Dps family)